MEEMREEKMTLDEAKKMFINPYWADVSGNIQPLCLCFKADKATKYPPELIPYASNVVSGTDPSGNDCKVILCNRCLEYNIKYQKEMEGQEQTPGDSGLYVPSDVFAKEEEN
jgi:hypothetical protein